MHSIQRQLSFWWEWEHLDIRFFSERAMLSKLSSISHLKRSPPRIWACTGHKRTRGEIYPVWNPPEPMFISTVQNCPGFLHLLSQCLWAGSGLQPFTTENVMKCIHSCQGQNRFIIYSESSDDITIWTLSSLQEPQIYHPRTFWLQDSRVSACSPPPSQGIPSILPCELQSTDSKSTESTLAVKQYYWEPELKRKSMIVPDWIFCICIFQTSFLWKCAGRTKCYWNA